jgi:hypothetical protein
VIQPQRLFGGAILHILQRRSGADGCAAGRIEQSGCGASKSFLSHLLDRSVRAQFRSEVYNVTNHAQFGGPNTSVSAASFGVLSSQANNPRDIPFGLKVSF